MKKMSDRRPTISINAWRVALNLEQTKSIQRDRNAPAYNCGCNLCVRWKKHYRKLLPSSLYMELSRALVDLDNPSELYEQSKDEGLSLIRVNFHIIGKILRGPQPAQPTEYGRHLYYSEIQKTPYVAIAVIRHAESYEYQPEYKKSSAGEAILLDMRVGLPS